MKSNNQFCIDQNLASTYINPAHYGKVLYEKQKRTKIGFRFTPFPLSSMIPDQSKHPADNIPRCESCFAFFNKFNVVRSDNTFDCSLCGHHNSKTLEIDTSSVEFKNEVYEAFAQQKYIIRKLSSSTDFYLISFQLLLRYPSILDMILDSYSSNILPKQVGIAFIHDSITVVKFRPYLTLQTYPDDEPLCKVSQLFIGTASFRLQINSIKDKIFSLGRTPSAASKIKAINFGLTVSSSFGSSLRIFLDESDFLCISNQPGYKEMAVNGLTYGCQASLFVFSNEPEDYQNIYSVPAITGGILRFFRSSISFETIEKEIKSCLDSYYVHDAFIFARGPNKCGLVDYAGSGYLKTDMSICISKVESSESFYFSFNTQLMKTRFFQFVLFYTSEMCMRRVRVFTFQLPLNDHFDPEITHLYGLALVSHRLLIEDEKSANEFIKRLDVEFPKFGFSLVETLMASDCKYQIAICARRGNSFQKLLEESRFEIRKRTHSLLA